MSAHREAHARLAAVARSGAAEIAIAEAALALAALEREETVDLAPYHAHLAALAAEVGGRYRESGAGPIAARLDAVNRTLFEDHGYHGDRASYDDLANADLISVIERRKGLPVALGILYLHSARAQGWRAVGINFPNHFVVAVEAGGERAIVDPFHAGVVRDEAALAAILRQTTGKDVALDPRLIAPVADRDVLVRLLNNLKTRHLGARHPEKAARVVERMLLIAPDRVELWGEAGVLQAEAGNIKTAIARLETFLERCGDAARNGEAAALMRRLRAQLN